MKNALAFTLVLAIASLGSAFAADPNDTPNPPDQAAASSYSSSTPSSVADTTRESSEKPGSDAWITMKVKAELMSTKDIPSLDVKVSTNNGVVTLAGQLDSKALVQKSVAAAKKVEGVKSVDSSALISRQ